jgi:S-adenosylmethionine synthetase
MIETLDLQNPFYARTAVGGHFGREDFPWERVDKVGLLLNAIL